MITLSERNKKYYEENKERLLAKAKENYENNKARIRISQKEYQYGRKEQISDYNKSYYDKNKETVKEYKNNWARNRSKNDPCFRLRRITSRAINRAISIFGGSKAGKSVSDYLPYTIQELKEHLEKQFEPWMRWDNHGVFIKNNYIENDPATWTWHIDHIMPISSFYFKTIEDNDFQKCWALSNLRPFKSIDNIKKSNKV